MSRKLPPLPANIEQDECCAERDRYRVALEAAKDLHKPDTVYVIAWACINGDCEHDDCPEKPKQVCQECWNLWTQDGRDDECFYEDLVMWPCATATALNPPEES